MHECVHLLAFEFVYVLLFVICQNIKISNLVSVKLLISNDIRHANFHKIHLVFFHSQLCTNWPRYSMSHVRIYVDQLLPYTYMSISYRNLEQ